MISTLLNNVCDELKGKLVMRELPKTLSDVITLCVKVDEHLRACGRTDVIEQGNLRADPAKVQAVVNWPTPSNHRQLQSFLVFANFFCRVIRDYSRLDLPCAYFSRRLYPAGKNYDMEDRELLAIKLALEEWCHWLEGAAQPSVVWTDHKTLFGVHPVS